MKWKLLLMWCIAPPLAFAQNVTVLPGTIVTINGIQTMPTLVNKGRVVLKENSVLTLTGTAYGTGFLAVTPTSSLTIQNAAGGIVYFDPSHNTLKNLSVYGGCVLGNTLNITAGSNAGSVKLFGNLFIDDSLILKSDAFGTARIDSSAGSIVGSVTVERYIPARRSWRFLTAPFATSDQSINQAWQEGYANTTLACPSQYIGTPGYGTHLTYNALNGYDPNVTNNPSIVYFSSVLNKWLAPLSTLTHKITDYNAYAIFVRGDRTVCLTQGINAAPVATTLRPIGEVWIGSVQRNKTAAPGQYILEGNPYASAIDLLPMSLRSNGIFQETWWIWDPHESVTGVYVSYNHGVSAPLTSNYSTAASARILESGQGVLVQANLNTQSIRYEEIDKLGSSRSDVFARPTAPHSVLHVQLLSSNHKLIDGIATRIAPDTTGMTSCKAWNFSGEGIALTRNDKQFGIETRFTKNGDTSFLYFKNMESSTYVLELFHSMNTTVRFVDRLLDKETVIIDTVRYTFEVTDSLSYSNRFIILYGEKETITEVQTISIYPNPVRDVLTIRGVTSGTPITISDILGKRLLQTTAHTINCAWLASGTYVIRIGTKAYPFQKL